MIRLSYISLRKKYFKEHIPLVISTGLCQIIVKCVDKIFMLFQIKIKIWRPQSQITKISFVFQMTSLCVYFKNICSL